LKFLGVFLIFCITLGCTACGEKDNVGKNVNITSSSETTITTTTSEKTAKTIESTTADTTNTTTATSEEKFNASVFEEIVKNINVSGFTVSLPSTIQTLNETFSVDAEPSYVDETHGFAIYKLSYKSNQVASAVVIWEENDKDITDNMVYGISFPLLYTAREDKTVNVKGLTYGSSKEDVENILGEPTQFSGSQDNTGYMYYQATDSKSISVNIKNGIVDNISIYVLADKDLISD
jgi:hypothetical protein